MLSSAKVNPGFSQAAAKQTQSAERYSQSHEEAKADFSHSPGRQPYLNVFERSPMENDRVMNEDRKRKSQSATYAAVEA